MTPTLTFTCSICGEPSKDICVYCTKDACRNHRCNRCKRCSDCCECEVPLAAEEPVIEETILAPETVPLNGAVEPAGGFSDQPPAPQNAPWVDVIAREPLTPDPPLEPEPAPAPEPPRQPEPFPQPQPEPRPEPPIPPVRMDTSDPASPPLPHPIEPQPEPEPDNPAPPFQPDRE
jgi:hypothetical protein